jgi:transketolase
MRMKIDYRQISNTIRGLSIDAIQKANSGHPGLPLGMADVATVLFNDFLKINPEEPDWISRDRFVLSGGHGSMLLYSLMHLYGFDVTLDDIKKFRQLGSKTAGHPEYGHIKGIETTTGPLGQGLANAVGLALAESNTSARINTEKFKIINHRTYVFAGDGDLMEGISHEVCSLAGHLKLNKLIVFYDQNHITIDGSTDLSCSDDVVKRFESYHWNVYEIDGHDYKQIEKAIKKARKSKSKPNLIICKTTIGFGSPNKAGTSHVHGSPLGVEEVKLTKENLEISPEEFFVSQEVYDICKNSINSKLLKFDRWERKIDIYKNKEHEKFELLKALTNKNIPDNFFSNTKFKFPKAIATRSASEIVLNSFFNSVPNLFGGSADLTPSNNTKPKDCKVYNPKNRDGRYMHYGIREHAMAGVMNGIALYSGLIPYGGTFMVFSDYLRPSLRLAALMKLQVINVFTHDSIGLGEDGPTHQPIEHLASLSLIPNVVNFRPMDAYETISAWKVALKRKDGPTNLIFSRQNLPVYKRGKGGLNNNSGAEKGAYVVIEDDDFEIILLASGSEVEIAINTKAILNEKGIKIRVISMPSKELFRMQAAKYRNQIIPQNTILKASIEAGITSIWNEFIGIEGVKFGIDEFGASGPYKELYQKYGLTADNISKQILKLLKKVNRSDEAKNRCKNCNTTGVA